MCSITEFNTYSPAYNLKREQVTSRDEFDLAVLNVTMHQVDTLMCSQTSCRVEIKFGLNFGVHRHSK